MSRNLADNIKKAVYIDRLFKSFNDAPNLVTKA